MNVVAAIFAFLALVSVMGLLFAFFEKLLNHRAEMARMRLEAQKESNVAFDRQILALREEIQALKERLDEQAIYLDDVRSVTPSVQQRLNG